MVSDAIRFGRFTDNMKQTFNEFLAEDHPDFLVSTSDPRIVEGRRTKNPRYLQNRPDFEQARDEYLSEVGMRLYRRIPTNKPVLSPVNAILPGRRHNPPDAKAGIRALCCYNPIHYQETPELFMDYIASLTGKSPSTTGAGSEGALTKGPFNALLPITDLNNALVALVLSREPCYISAAGFVGPKCRVNHDVSLLIPEVWSRMHISERDPQYLIEKGLLEPLEDCRARGCSSSGQSPGLSNYRKVRLSILRPGFSAIPPMSLPKKCSGLSCRTRPPTSTA